MAAGLVDSEGGGQFLLVSFVVSLYPIQLVLLYKIVSYTSCTDSCGHSAMSKVSAFVDSMVDELGADGSLPDVVPFQRFGGRPADLSWSAAFLENLWSLWQDS